MNVTGGVRVDTVLSKWNRKLIEATVDLQDNRRYTSGGCIRGMLNVIRTPRRQSSVVSRWVIKRQVWLRYA